MANFGCDIILVLLTCILPCDNFLARDSIYAIVRYMLSPIRLSVCHMGGSVKDGLKLGSRNLHHRVAP